MPDISMVQQALHRSVTPAATSSDYQRSPTSTFLISSLDDHLAPVTTTSATCTFTPARARIGQATTLSRSQSQVVQFLNTGTVSSLFDCPGAPLHDRLEYLHLKKSTVKTPVMHPNLVCTLKSILSPKLEFLDSQSLISGNSPIPVETADSVHGLLEERISALAGAEDSSSSKPGSPELFSSTWPTMQELEKGKILEPEAVLVPVDLIQNKRPYHCAFTGCQRTFKNPQTMRMHHKTHFNDAAGAKALAGADQSSSPSGSLVAMAPGCATQPKAGHNKKIPSRCPACYKTFVGLYELRRHFGRKHSEGEKRHACCKCGKRFHVEVDVRDHEKLCGEPIVCNCGMKFAFKCNLVAHKRTHPKCQDLRPTTSNHNGDAPDNTNHDQMIRKRRKLADQRSPSPVRSGEISEIQAPTSPVQPCIGRLNSTASGSAPSSSSPFSSMTSSPSSSSAFVAEALPDFDVTSCGSSLLVDYHDPDYNSCLNISAGHLLQGYF